MIRTESCSKAASKLHQIHAHTDSVRYGTISGMVPALLITAVSFVVTPALAMGDKSPYDWAFVRLDYARAEKVQQLRAYWEKTRELAQKAASDAIVSSCFQINLEYVKATQECNVPEDLKSRVTGVRSHFASYYLANYLAFYDMLFIDPDGDVFFSIRNQPHFNNNLLDRGGTAGGLGSCLREKPQGEVFVDFRRYAPLSEPAAFLVEPMYDQEGRIAGWIALQCAINRVNTLIAYTDDLGETGETFLVNEQGFMLTESNFEGASTILTRHLDNRNIRAKFTEKQGHRVVRDYRGCEALTSFEVVEFMSTRWLVVAKVDVHEIVTRHYAQHRMYFGDKLLTYLKDTPVAPLRSRRTPDAGAALQVDMDEFLKAAHGERLRTFGLSTCTGLLAAYPGKFAYLAHVSPKDRVYGAEETNLVGQVVKKVKTFDVYPCDRHRIVFTVVSTHLDSLLAITDKLIEEKFFLSQIRVLYNPHAATAEISYDYETDDLVVSWQSAGSAHEWGTHAANDARNAEFVIREIMDIELNSALLADRGELLEEPAGPDSPSTHTDLSDSATSEGETQSH